MTKYSRTAALIIAVSVAGIASADVDTYRLRDLKGYTIIDVLTIVGYQDKDGKSKDEFEGCDFGRVIVFEGNKALTCSGYGYQYAYRPEAVIFGRGGQFKMLVDSEMYDMR